MKNTLELRKQNLKNLILKQKDTKIAAIMQKELENISKILEYLI